MTTPPLSLSLRPSPSNETAQAEQLTLAHVLARITAEYGPTFASVTEEKLQAEIEKSQDKDVEMEDVAPTEENANLVTREELQKLVQIAFEESSLAQDFISLLLSTVRPAAGGAGMSPTLKAAVPLGALGGSRVAPPNQKPDMSISMGWKKSALDQASQTLMAAAERLAGNSGAASKFIEGVLKIRAAGWRIVQMPGEAQQSALKVFYGFQKAGSDYHDPGVGYLKESASGEVVFIRDPRLADKKGRVLRIRVETQNGTTSSFAGPKDYSNMDLSDVEIELHKARDSLFDEELYHELTKEARVISNSGVVITETEIHVPLADGSKVLIDLIDPEVTDPETPSQLATGILLALSTLLSYAYHLNLKKRQEIPEPLSVRKPQVRPMILLRPLLAFATHSNLLHLAETYFKDLIGPFQSALLPCSLEISRYSNLDNLSKSATPPELMETLLTTTESKLDLYLPSDSSLSLHIQTPYQHSQNASQWLAPFTLKTSSLFEPDGEIFFDALSDAESPIMLAVEESLATTASQCLGPAWRKIEMREFECKGRRVRVELRNYDGGGKIVVVDGSEDIICDNMSLLNVLTNISGS